MLPFSLIIIYDHKESLATYGCIVSIELDMGSLLSFLVPFFFRDIDYNLTLSNLPNRDMLCQQSICGCSLQKCTNANACLNVLVLSKES